MFPRFMVADAYRPDHMKAHYVGTDGVTAWDVFRKQVVLHRMEHGLSDGPVVVLMQWPSADATRWERVMSA